MTLFVESVHKTNMHTDRQHIHCKVGVHQLDTLQLTHTCTVHVHESSVGLFSTTNPKPRGKPSPSACTGTPRYHQQKAEPPRCLALRTRGGRLHVHATLYMM